MPPTYTKHLSFYTGKATGIKQLIVDGEAASVYVYDQNTKLMEPGDYTVKRDSITNQTIIDFDIDFSLLDKTLSVFIYYPHPFGETKTLAISNQCSHEFVPYTGLFESYEYCKKCDQKK